MDDTLEICPVSVKKITNTATLPSGPKSGDVGYDLFVDSFEELPGNIIRVKTGLCIQPKPGWYFDLVPRSSIYKKGLFMCNSLGIIDNSYQGEIMAHFYKTENFTSIEKGERIMQLIPRKYHLVEFKEVSEFKTKTSRAEGGFGSSGL